MEAEEAGPGIGGVGKDVAHIVKEDEADRVAEPGKVGRRQAQFGAVDERACAADGVAGLRIARAGGVDGEAAQRGGSAGVEALGKGNQFAGGVTKGALLAVAGVAGEHVAALIEAVVARVGNIEAVELGLRAELPGGEELLEAGVGAAMGIEGRVARIANPGEGGAGDADRGGELRNLAWSDLKGSGLDLDAAEVELIDEGVGFGEDGPGSGEVLRQASAGFELGGYVGGDVKAVGVAAGPGETKSRLPSKCGIW